MRSKADERRVIYMSNEEFKHNGLIPNVTKLKFNEDALEDPRNYDGTTTGLENLEFMFLGFAGKGNLVLAKPNGDILYRYAEGLQIIPTQETKPVTADLAKDLREITDLVLRSDY